MRFVLIACLALLACDPSAAPPANVPAVDARPVVETPARVSLMTPLPSSSRTFGVEANGSLDVIMGSLRVNVLDARITFAEDTDPIGFASPIVEATRVAGGFVFVSADGLVARSETFQGPLRRVGDLKRHFFPTWSSGRATWIDDRGALVTTTGDALTAISLPGPAIGAAFVDELRGAAALDSGALVRTIDGGAHWTTVAMGNEAAAGVFTRGNALAVYLASTAVRGIADDGTLAPEPAEKDRPHLTQAQFDQLYERWKKRNAGNHAKATRPTDSIEVAPNRIMETYPWGENTGALAIADPHGPIRATFRLYRSHNGEPWERFANGPVSKASIAFSTDGQHVVWPGECAVPSKDAPDTVTFPLGASDVLCALAGVHDRGHTWPTRPAVQTLLSMRGDGALYIAADGSLQELHGDTGKITQLAHAHGDLVVTDAAYGSDGALVVIYSDGKRTEASLGPRGSASLEPLKLPGKTNRVAFADKSRGVAVGQSAADVFRTKDGGATWEPVPLPVGGDAAALSLKGALHCDAEGCVVEDALAIKGWGAFTSSAQSLLASGTPMAPESSPPTFIPQETHLRCVRATAPSAKKLSTPTPNIFKLAAVGATADLESGNDTQGHHALRARWAGTDAHGPFAAEMKAPAISPESFTYVLRGATRAGMLFERCPEIAMGVGCTLLWATAGGGLRELPFGSAVSEFDEPKGTPLGALPLADGSVMIALWTRQHDDSTGLSTGPTVDHIVRIAKDGAIADERWFAWKTELTRSEMSGGSTWINSWARLRALGTFHGDAGLFVADRDDARAMRFFPLERGMTTASIDVPQLLPVKPAACTGAADPAAALMTVAALETWSMAIDPGDKIERSGTRAFIELTARETCVRHIDTWGTGGHSINTRWPGNGLMLDARPDGTFKGTVLLDSAREPVTCSFGQ